MCNEKLDESETLSLSSRTFTTYDNRHHHTTPRHRLTDDHYASERQQQYNNAKLHIHEYLLIHSHPPLASHVDLICIIQDPLFRSPNHHMQSDPTNYSIFYSIHTFSMGKSLLLLTKKSRNLDFSLVCTRQHGRRLKVP